MIMGVVADDITGSNDIGIMFAKSGCLTHVYEYSRPGDYNRVHQKGLSGRFGEPDITILDTNSRLDTPRLAYEKVFAATSELRAAGCQRYFNKTCSVFRGNIGAEFDAMLDALELDFAVVVLGFPKNGRITLNGIHYVYGKPLAESEFRHDPIHPMRTSNLVEILSSQTHRKVALSDHVVISQGVQALKAEIQARRGTCNYLILDVADQEALRTIAAAVRDEPVLCGSSAIGEELPAAWGIPLAKKWKIRPPDPSSAGILCIAGSLMPQTADQIRYLQKRGVLALALNHGWLFEPKEREAGIRQLSKEIARQLIEGKNVILHSAGSPIAVAETVAMGAEYNLTRTETSRLVTETLAEITALVLSICGQNRLVVAGGETSAAVCARLGVEGVMIWKEIQPGLPSCLSLSDPPMLLVLKSGSFGSSDFLEQAIEHLRSSEH